MIDTNSDTWADIKAELEKKRDEALSKLLKSRENDDMHRGTIALADHILKLPESQRNQPDIQVTDNYID